MKISRYSSSATCCVYGSLRPITLSSVWQFKPNRNRLVATLYGRKSRHLQRGFRPDDGCFDVGFSKSALSSIINRLHRPLGCSRTCLDKDNNKNRRSSSRSLIGIHGRGCWARALGVFRRQMLSTTEQQQKKNIERRGSTWLTRLSMVNDDI